MKHFKLLFAFALIFIANFSSNAQSVDEIIDKYVSTIGGADKWKAVQGIKMEMSVNQGGTEIPIEMIQMPAGKMIVKVNLNGKEITQMASDGETMWSQSFMTMKPEKMDKETTDNAKLSSADFPDALIDYKTKGYQAEFVGKETKEGTECYKIKFTKKPKTIAGVLTDDVTFYFFDTDNNLVIATETEIKEGPMKGQKALSTMSDYQEVDGLYFPFAMTQFGSPLKIKKIIVNPAIDIKIFSFPAQ